MANSRSARSGTKRARKPTTRARRAAHRARLVRLGELIAQARAARHLTQREVAVAIGRTAPAVCDYEAGRREPPGLTLIDLIAALDMKVGRLASGCASS